MAGDHNGIPFLEARKADGSPMYTRGRPDGPPLWIVIHDMEEEETTKTALNVAKYFNTGAGGRSVSSHYTADSGSIYQCVMLADSAWTVGNRQGNNRGINWELAGFGSQTREQWLDAFGRAMFALIAPIIRADAAKFDIPLRTLTDDEVRANKPGVTSHWQLGRVFGKTDHQDPGPNFPWDYFMSLLTGTVSLGDDMALIVRDRDRDKKYFVIGGDGVAREYVGGSINDLGWLASGRFNNDGKPGYSGLPYANKTIGAAPWIEIPVIPVAVLAVSTATVTVDVKAVAAAAAEGAADGARAGAPTHEALVQAVVEGAQKVAAKVL